MNSEKMILKGSCFKILSDELSWEKAREQCMSIDQGSDLASIHTEQENEFVKSKLIFCLIPICQFQI